MQAGLLLSFAEAKERRDTNVGQTKERKLFIITQKEQNWKLIVLESHRHPPKESPTESFAFGPIVPIAIGTKVNQHHNSRGLATPQCPAVKTPGGREDADFVGGTEKYMLIHELNFEAVLL
jgi:hypothetical protein